MSFLGKIADKVPDPLTHFVRRTDPIDKGIQGYLNKPAPPPTPGPPDPNAAANASRNLTDQMRMRRGLLANIYAGGQPANTSAPVTGKTTLGT